MTHSLRLAVLPLLGLLTACGSTDAEDAIPAGAGSGGTASGGVATTGGVESSGGLLATGGDVAMTGGAFSSGGMTWTGGTDPGTGGQGSGGDSTGGQGTGGQGTGGQGTGGDVTGGQGTGGDVTGGQGTGGSTSVGQIRVTDPVPGFASVAGGTTGGGTDLTSALTVTTMSQLQSAAGGSNPALILVTPGNYSGTLSLGSNKTILGTAPGVTLTGNVRISGASVSNVIIRNLAVRGLPCSSYDECREGDDAVYVGSGAHHVWLDHLDIADGQDGNCDITQGGDYVTVSWSHFHYTYDKEHRFSNLIAGSDDEPASVGKLRITYMNSHWGERVDSRQPRGRFGNVHLLNNLHDTGGGQIHGVGYDMALIAERCVYHENRSIWTDMGSPRGWRGIENEGTASDLNASFGTVFDIPYAYTPLPAAEVVAAVTAATCGAGNSCTLAY